MLITKELNIYHEMEIMQIRAFVAALYLSFRQFDLAVVAGWACLTILGLVADIDDADEEVHLWVNVIKNTSNRTEVAS